MQLKQKRPCENIAVVTPQTLIVLLLIAAACAF
jgi:hypothetical protein